MAIVVGAKAQKWEINSEGIIISWTNFLIVKPVV